MAIDQIEREIKDLFFETMQYKETNIRIIKNSENVSQIFEELAIKLQAVKSNEFAKFQLDRISKIEKDITFLQGSFEGWIRVQKKWVYLEPIYTQDDVVANLRS